MAYFTRRGVGLSEEEVLRIPADHISIGRAPHCGIVLDDPEAEPEHARIAPYAGGYLLLDGSGEKGTFVNGRRITQHLLEPGDVVRLGATQLRFHEDGPARRRERPASRSPLRSQLLAVGAAVFVVGALLTGPLLYLVASRWPATPPGPTSPPLPTPTPPALAGLPLRPVAGATPEPEEKPTPEEVLLAAEKAARSSRTASRSARSRVLESAEGHVDGAFGGIVTLSSGESLEVPKGALAGLAEVRLTRESVPPLPRASDLRGELVTLSSEQRPRLLGDTTLVLRAPAGGAAQAYMVLGPVLLPTASLHDAAQAVVRVASPEIAVRAGDARERAEAPGYVVGPPGLAPEPTSGCTAGEPGQVFEPDAGAFSFLFLAQGSCAVVRTAAATLAEAMAAYGRDFRDLADRPPLSHLGPRRRMRVRLIDSGPLARYDFGSVWQGFLQVNVAAAEKDPGGLREALYRELFRAVHDQQANLHDSSPTVAWWAEAAAQFASLRARRSSLPEAVAEALARHPHLLSVPPPRSAEGSALLARGEALLMNHVERQSPGYLRRTLSGWKEASPRLWDAMQAAGRLPATYPAYLQEVLGVALSGSNPPWTQGRLVESEIATRLLFRTGGDTGGKAETERKLTQAAQRTEPQSFPPLAVEPFTARFYQVSSERLERARQVRVRLEARSGPPVRALIARVARQPAPAVQFASLDDEAVVTGLGQGIDEVWVIVHNPSSEGPAAFRLQLRLEAETNAAPAALVDCGDDCFNACMQPAGEVPPLEEKCKLRCDRLRGIQVEDRGADTPAVCRAEWERRHGG